MEQLILAVLESGIWNSINFASCLQGPSFNEIIEIVQCLAFSASKISTKDLSECS